MRKERMVIDAGMTILLPLLMAYSLIGETFHEIAGMVLFLLFILHNWLNRGFWKALFKGRYNFQRAVRTLINTALFIILIVQTLSGIVISNHFHVLLPVSGMVSISRQAHLALAYWGFILMSLHGGMHIDMMFRGRNKDAEKPRRLIPFAEMAVAGVYGAWVFLKRDFPSYMFLHNEFVFFNYEEPLFFFFFDYLMIMILFGMAGYLLAKLK